VILNRHAANLRGLALAESRYGDHTPIDDVFAAVRAAVDRDRDRMWDGGRFALHGRFPDQGSGRCLRPAFAKVSAGACAIVYVMARNHAA
jgi:hypothetical protein